VGRLSDKIGIGANPQEKEENTYARYTWSLKPSRNQIHIRLDKQASPWSPRTLSLSSIRPYRLDSGRVYNPERPFPYSAKSIRFTSAKALAYGSACMCWMRLCHVFKCIDTGVISTPTTTTTTTQTTNRREVKQWQHNHKTLVPLLPLLLPSHIRAFHIDIRGVR
jgi:hypothetical protein